MKNLSGRPSNFRKDQRVYTWNGTQHCVHCHKITVKGECPHQCTYWLELGFNLETGIGDCLDCGAPIHLGAPATSEKGSQIHPQADSFTVFSLNTAEGLQLELVCDLCSDVRLDQSIDQGRLVQDETGAWFDPELFPEKTGYRIGTPVPPDEDHPSYLAIEAAIAAGEAFQCSYCGITDDISRLDEAHPGVHRCLTCADKHSAATYQPLGRVPGDTDPEPASEKADFYQAARQELTRQTGKRIDEHTAEHLVEVTTREQDDQEQDLPEHQDPVRYANELITYYLSDQAHDNRQAGLSEESI
jgi:hypothetical protein